MNLTDKKQGPFEPARMVSWLGAIIDSEQTIEVRTLGHNGRKSHSKYFKGSDLYSLAVYAQQMDFEGAKGVYFTFNPLRSDLIRSTASAKDSDVVVRKWILVDIDPERPADTSATERQKQDAWDLVVEVHQLMAGEDLGVPVVIDSGNGFHLYYPIVLANTEDAKKLCRDLLHQLHHKLSVKGAAHIDISTSNASRISRIPGTLARKGPDPSKWTRGFYMGLISEVKQLKSWHSPESCYEKIKSVVDRWKAAEELRKGRPQDTTGAYAAKAFQEELAKLAGAGPGERNNQLNRSAHALGSLIAGGYLDRATVERALSAAAMGIGLGQEEIETTLASGLRAGEKEPRKIPEGPKQQSASSPTKIPGLSAEEDVPVYDPNDIATIYDLERAGAEINWIWEGWLQRNVVVAIGAEPECGKTRFICDLIRRVAHGLPWPDGQPMNLSPEEKFLWVLADNNHDEMVTVARDFQIQPNIIFNASSKDPYSGTVLENAKDLSELEGRIKAAKPMFIVIDTVGNSSGKNLTRSEEATAYYQPLQLIARRNQVVILCLTHLNAGGRLYGRRVLEKVRVAITMERPDPSQEDRRSLYVIKSNSKKPPKLGVTVTGHGNEYDLNPPEKVSEEDAKSGSNSPRLREVMSWLQDQLQPGPKRVSVLRNLAESAGFDGKLLYRGKHSMQIEEYESESKKWWRLTSTDQEI